ncbi:MAG TPA: hypothetical protein VI454_13240 [Verrucomicrobiae bacterium]
MKIVISSLLFAGLVSAQTNEIIPILSVGDRVFTNARITSVTAGDAVVMFQGGGTRVKLENLPEPFRTKYYDPEKAAKYLAVQKQKQEESAARQQAERVRLFQAENARGEEQRIRVLKITGSYGYSKCLVEAQGRQQEILFANLPAEVGGILGKVQDLQSRLEGFASKVEADARAAKVADAVALTGAAGSQEYVDAAMAQRRRANLMAVNAENQQEDLAKMKVQLVTLQDDEKRIATVLARPTGKIYANLRIWEYTGRALTP